jgi:hypothetical protein
MCLVSLLTVGIGGCTSRIVVGQNEIESIKDKRIVRAVHPAMLIGLTLKSGERVEYSEPGAQFDAEKCLVKGNSIKGLIVEHLCDSILFVEYMNTDISSRFVKIEELLKYNLKSPGNGRIKSSGLFNPNWNVLEFDRAGGRIDYEGSQLTGLTNKGTTVNVALDELDHVVIKKKNPIKTIRIALSFAYLVFLANAAFDVVDLKPD